MCKEISILRRWQPVLARAPCHWSPVREKVSLVTSGLSNSFDRNFLVVPLYYILVKWVRCHLDLIEVEVIETSNLATVPSRHVSGYMANCWLWLGDFHHHHHHHRRRSLQVNGIWYLLYLIVQHFVSSTIHVCELLCTAWILASSKFSSIFFDDFYSTFRKVFKSFKQLKRNV